jgi:hypothetical protein
MIKKVIKEEDGWILKLALSLQILLFLYFEITTLVNLYPWKDLSKYSYKEKMIKATL